MQDRPWTSSRREHRDAAEVALTEEQEDGRGFNRVDVSGDGHISVIEAIRRRGARVRRPSRPTSRDCWASAATRVHQGDGTRDKLMLAFGALDADGDKRRLRNMPVGPTA